MRKNFICFIISLLLFACTSEQQKLKVSGLQCNYLSNPMGIEGSTPLLSWKILSESSNVNQDAYRILVSDNKQQLEAGTGDVWDSGKVGDHNSLMIKYSGSDLEAGKTYYWKIKVWDQNGEESNWSEVSSWQMAIGNENLANAKWIGYEEFDENQRLVPGIPGYGYKLEKEINHPVVPLFRKSFKVKDGLKSAILSLSGIGHYEASVNGEKLGDSFMTPGWTDFDKRILYNTYDVASELKQGENVLGVIVGKGFINNTKERYRKLIISYGNPKMIAHLKLTYDDGTEETIYSDETWKTAFSPITFSNIYGGEDYDAGLEQKGWNNIGFDDSGWKPALLVKPNTGKLASELGHPVKVMETFDPVSINKMDDENFVYDFGQNIAGIVEIQVEGEKGQQVKIWPCELTNEDGSYTQKWTGHPHYYSYTLKGEGIETWRPRFAYYGFRYAQVEGAVTDTSSNPKELPVVKKLTSLHTRNSMPENGTFECSNELFNRIYTLINWGIKNNLQSMMTDCPHREKLGWIEQAYLMGESVHYNWDTYHLYKNILYNMMAGQYENGLVPNFLPEYVYFGGAFTDSPEWGSACIILPWMLYKWYGDFEIVKESWPMMQKYINYLDSKSEGNILMHGLGDWYDIGPELPGFSQLTPMGLTATATYFYDLELLAKISGLMGDEGKKQLYKTQAGNVKDAFNSKFFNKENSVYGTGSQTCQAMPLVVGLVEEQYRDKVLKNLVDSIRANNKMITAGDIGFHYLVSALVDGGQGQLLFEMNNRVDVPGYGYQLEKGATALAESWEALARKSNNHLMLGHVMEWFYSGIAGIQQTDSSVAYKELLIKPQIVGDIQSAKATFNSPYGEVVSDWKLVDNTYCLNVNIPANSSALVSMPGTGKVSISNPQNSKLKELENKGKIANGRTIFKVGSGKYVFKMEMGK